MEFGEEEDRQMDPGGPSAFVLPIQPSRSRNTRSKSVDGQHGWACRPAVFGLVLKMNLGTCQGRGAEARLLLDPFNEGMLLEPESTA